jgi:single-stranded-DNA-specific exonuclease
VASRIAETFSRPVIILSVEGDTARGSARSIPSLDIYYALSACRDCLSRFGGHKQAAGLELRSKDIPFFEDSLNRVVVDLLSDQDFTPALHIDSHIDLCNVSFRLLKEFEMLEPFGTGNPEPLLGSKSLEVVDARIVGNGHLKMKLKQKKNVIDAIGFDLASYMATLESSYKIDAVFTPFINEWNGSRHLSLNLKALRPSTEN